MGFLDKLFKKNPDKKKILSNFEIQDLISKIEESNRIRLSKIEEQIFNFSEVLNDLGSKLLDPIPEEYQEIITKISGSVGGLSVPDEDIYRIIKAFEGIVFTKDQILKKTETTGKKCYKCGAEVIEGFYYKVGDKVACLSHLNEAEPINKGVKQNASKKSKLHGKRNDNRQAL